MGEENDYRTLEDKLRAILPQVTIEGVDLYSLKDPIGLAALRSVLAERASTRLEDSGNGDDALGFLIGALANTHPEIYGQLMAELKPGVYNIDEIREGCVRDFHSPRFR